MFGGGVCVLGWGIQIGAMVNSWMLVDLGYMAVGGTCGFMVGLAVLVEREFESRLSELVVRIAVTVGMVMSAAAAGGLFTEAWKLGKW